MAEGNMTDNRTGTGAAELDAVNEKLDKLTASAGKIIQLQNKEQQKGAMQEVRSGDEAGDDMQKALIGAFAEFIATMTFVFIGVGAACSNGIGANPGYLLPSFAFGIGITVLAFAFGPVSGAHINPAVTLAVALCGKIKPVAAILYVFAQLIGAIVGAAIVLGGLPGPSDGAARDVLKGACNFVREDRGYELGDAFLYEAMGTFILVFTVLRTAVDKVGHDSVGASGAPLAIGLAVFLSHLVLVPSTNCSINPARSFGPSVVANKWDDHYIFWTGPITGSLFAVAVYKVILAGPQERLVCRAPAGNEPVA